MVVDPAHHRPDPVTCGQKPDGEPAPVRPVAAPFVSRTAGESGRAKPALHTNGAVRLIWARWANWVVGASAAVFLMVTLGVYLYHRGQLADIAAEHLRLMVTGPAVVHVGMPQRYTVRTTAVTGRPAPGQIEFTLYGPDGRQLMAHKEAADEQGAVEIAVEADSRWPREVRMAVIASYSSRTERVEARLAVQPIGCRTALSLERSSYGRGETLRYRSLTVSQLGLTADREAPVRFEVRAPNGSLAADSVREGMTTRGAGWGEYRIPKDCAEGVYAVVATSPGREFPEVRRQFTVADRPVRSAPVAAGGIRVRFQPEGGELVGGMENRLYFSASDASGRPARFTGRIVDSQGRTAALAETTYEGMGSLQFEPLAGEQYRLQIDHPRGSQGEIKLPPVSGNHAVVLTTGLGILEPGAPLEFNVRATAAGLPLVAAVWCRGVEVGQQTLVTSPGANTVSVPLDGRAAGAMRLALYEYRSSPPKLLAQRLIYRRPPKRLVVRAVLPDRRLRPGESLDLPLCVTDEQGRPVEADVSVAVCEAAQCPPGAIALAPAMSQLLLLDELENPLPIENLDFLLSGDPKAPAALDLVLGAETPEVSGTAPIVLDNLGQLIERYQASVASYHVNRTRVLNALTTLSFFGGIGLVVFVAMLSLLNIPCGLRLWGPALGVAAVCVVVGAVLTNPERLKPSRQDDVPFASCATAPTAPQRHPPQVNRAGERPRNLESFVPSAYAYRNDSKNKPAAEDTPAALVWRPLVRTDSQGRAAVPIPLPAHPSAYRIMLDAHAASGRMGTSSLLVRP